MKSFDKVLHVENHIWTILICKINCSIEYCVQWFINILKNCYRLTDLCKYVSLLDEMISFLHGSTARTHVKCWFSRNKIKHCTFIHQIYNSNQLTWHCWNASQAYFALLVVIHTSTAINQSWKDGTLENTCSRLRLRICCSTCSS